MLAPPAPLRTRRLARLLGRDAMRWHGVAWDGSKMLTAALVSLCFPIEDLTCRLSPRPAALVASALLIISSLQPHHQHPLFFSFPILYISRPRLHPSRPLTFLVAPSTDLLETRATERGLAV